MTFISTGSNRTHSDTPPSTANRGDADVMFSYNKRRNTNRNKTTEESLTNYTPSPSQPFDASKIAIEKSDRLNETIQKILNTYPQTTYLNNFSRVRFRQRRSLQTAMLSKATHMQKPEQKMAVILAVYKSLQSEGFLGEKWHWFGKSKLEKQMEIEFGKIGIFLQNYDTVQDADANTKNSVDTLPETHQKKQFLDHLKSVVKTASERPVKRKWCK
jgi:hypothetical protein